MSIDTQKMNEAILQQIKICCEAIEDKKGENIVVLQMPKDASIASYFIIADGKSEAQLRAMKKSVEDALELKHGKSNTLNSGWQLIDLFDFVVHLFSEEKRSFYNLEQLWKDGRVIEV
jgi:ribosome-associated protein